MGGTNGEVTYIDDTMNPFPAIRFQEDTGAIAALRTKEKGDWKKLTLEEKKALYRASFCQTLVECEAPSGEWKNVLAGTLFLCSVCALLMVWIEKNCFDETPVTITDEAHQKAQIDRMIALRINPVEGLGSKYDYEKGKWK